MQKEYPAAGSRPASMYVLHTLGIKLFVNPPISMTHIPLMRFRTAAHFIDEIRSDTELDINGIVICRH